MIFVGKPRKDNGAGRIDGDEYEVYHFVEQHASRYYEVIIKALNAGIRNENNRLINAQAKVEVGLCLLLDQTKLDKIPSHQKPLIKQALEAGKFFNYDGSIKKLDFKE